MDFDLDAEGDESAETNEPWRPNTNVLDDPERFGYKVFNKPFDEEIEDVPDHVRDQLRSLAEHRGNAAWERLGRQEEESPAAAYRRLRRVMLSAERDEFVKARDSGEIDDEVLFRVLRELDLEEAALSRE